MKLFWAAGVFAGGLAMAQSPSEDLAALSRSAKQLMSEGRFEEAIPICERLVKAAPRNTGLILNLGLAEEMAGHPDLAVPRFEEVLKAEPGNVPALTSLASVRLQLKQARAATVPLKKILTIQPSNREARKMLADALMDADQLDEAAEQYRSLAARFSSDAAAWYGLGKAYEALSARLFERINKDSSESPYTAALIAASRLSQQRYKSAFLFFGRAQETLPNLRGLHAGLAKVYRETGHPDWAAIEEKQEETLPAPNCALVPAECDFMQNRYLEGAKAASMNSTPPSLYWGVKAYNQLALEAFGRLSGLPDSVELHALHAQILDAHNQHVEASNEWRAALRLTPDNKRLERELATSLFLGRDYKTAMPLVETLLRDDGKSSDLNFMMGESLLRSEQPDKAVPYLEAALRADEKMLPADASLGLALSKLDRGREAIPHLERALPLDDDGSLHYPLARAYQQAGNTQRARELMEQYQRIQKQNEEQKDELAKGAEIAAPTL